MEPFTLIVVAILTIIIFVYFLQPKKRPTNFPPGPKPVPIFGNALQLGATKHSKAVELEQLHGPVIGLQIGSYWMVIFNDADDIRDILSQNEYAARYGYDPFHEMNVKLDMKGPLMSQGEHWQDIRRWTLKTLRDYGFGKRSMESIIQEETQQVLTELKKKLGAPITTERLFHGSVLNVIWSLVAGERFKFGDERLDELLNLVFEVLSNSFKGTKLLNFMFPTVVQIRAKISAIYPSENDRLRNRFMEFLQGAIDDHRKTMQVGQPRDFIDSYLEESLRRVDNPSLHFGNTNDDMGLIYTAYDLFGAGSDTTSTTLCWAMFFLALHPAEQEALHKEIETIGSRVVTLEDRPNMPVTEATMAEILRASSLLSIGSPHATSDDVIFKGYHIPKNTLILPNIYAAHHNKKTWGDPEKFRPGRFIGKDGKFLKHPHFIPFGTGKRQCLGEKMARDEFFVFLTNIVQQLKITMPEDEPEHSLVGRPGIVLTPEPHRIIFTERN